MKKLWTGIMITAMAFALQVNAALYTENFNSNPGYVATGDFAIGAAGSSQDYDVAFGQWAGTSTIPMTQANGVLSIGSDTGGGSARSRAFGLFIDTSAAVAGTYTVSFDILNWVAGTGTAGMKIWEGSDLTTQYVVFDAGGNNDSGNWPDNDGTASETQIYTTGAGSTGITGNQSFSFDVELTEAGTAGDFMMFAFGQVRSTSSALAPTFDIDNVNVAIPEPATIGMLGLGALVSLLIRRRLTA